MTAARRARSTRSAARALAALALAALACSEPATGPARVVWGRHACDHCGMAISEPRFAAQVRIGRRVARFDDFGCAVLWLDRHREAEAGAEIWAMDQDRAQWIDARLAFYRPRQRTPMAYGLGALGAPEAGALAFEAARQSIRESERERAEAAGRRP